MPPVVIVDTSVLLNVFDVPRFNQDRDAVLDRFGELVEAGANFLLPLGTVLETGNHIADIATANGGDAMRPVRGPGTKGTEGRGALGVGPVAGR